MQRNVLSDNPGLVDCSVGMADFVHRSLDQWEGNNSLFYMRVQSVSRLLVLTSHLTIAKEIGNTSALGKEQNLSSSHSTSLHCCYSDKSVTV